MANRVDRLTDGVVTLRLPVEADMPALVEFASDAEMLRWTTVPRPYTLDNGAQRISQVEQHWAEPVGHRSFAVEWLDDGQPRFGGMIDLHPAESPAAASVGFGLHPGARGRGLMSRAVRLVAAHAFADRPWGAEVTRLHWRAIVGNWGSRRVAWATGFTFHATLPESHVDSSNPAGPALDSWHASLRSGDPMEPQAPWFEPPVLQADGIRLRPWRDSDIDAIEERRDPAHWMPPHSVLGQEMFAGWLRRRRELMATGASLEWCVADAESDRALGSAVVFSRGGPITGDVAELGYQLFPSARGRGVAKAAARLCIAHAFAPKESGGLGLRRLVAETAADNTASNRVLEANGFAIWGREPSVDPFPDGTYGDGLHWSLISTSR